MIPVESFYYLDYSAIEHWIDGFMILKLKTIEWGIFSENSVKNSCRKQFDSHIEQENKRISRTEGSWRSETAVGMHPDEIMRRSRQETIWSADNSSFLLTELDLLRRSSSDSVTEGVLRGYWGVTEGLLSEHWDGTERTPRGCWEFPITVRSIEPSKSLVDGGLVKRWLVDG